MKEQTILRGKKLVIAIAVAFAFLEILLLGWARVEHMPVPNAPIVRVVFTVILIVLMYKGYDWAKFVLIFAGFAELFGGLMLLYATLKISLDIISLVISFAYVVITSWVAVTLIFSSSISEFIQSQKKKRELGAHS